MKFVIPGAELGTRFLPHMKAQPKEMIPVVDKPAIQYVVEEAVAAGFHDILIVTGRGKRAIEDRFEFHADLEALLRARGLEREYDMVRALASLAKILYVRQGDPRGLGHAVLSAERYVGREHFAVMLGDGICVSKDPCIGDPRRISEQVGAAVIAVSRAPHDRVPRYGMVTGKEVEPGLLRVEGIVKKPAPSRITSNLLTIGRYFLTLGFGPSCAALDRTGAARFSSRTRSQVSPIKKVCTLGYFPGDGSTLVTQETGYARRSNLLWSETTSALTCVGCLPSFSLSQAIRREGRPG